MAYRGMGVYSLAMQTVLSSLIKVVLFWIFAKWFPKERFSKGAFLELWNFGSKLLGANLIGTLFNQIYTVIIGKYVGKKELGYFSKANGLCTNVDGVTSGIVQKVALPVLARYQGDEDELTKKFRTIMRLLVMMIAPMTAILCFSSDEIVILLWTEKWLYCSFLFKVLIVGIMFGPLGQMSLSLMQTVGKTSMILKLEMPKKVLYCIYIIIGFQYGVLGLAVAQVFINISGSLVNMWATKKILPYSYWGQIKDIVRYMILAFGIAAVVDKCVHCENLMLVFIVKTIIILLIYMLLLIVSRDSVLMQYIIRFKKRKK